MNEYTHRPPELIIEPQPHHRVDHVVNLRPLKCTSEDECPAPTEIQTSHVTLTLPDRPKRSPLDKYKSTVEEAPLPNPNRFTLQRLGLSEAEFDAKVTAEVDELLRECKAERRWNQLAVGSSPQAPRVLT